MSFSIQRMFLINKPENEEYYGELSLTVDSSKSLTFTIGYQGKLRVNYGDGITETLNSTSFASKSHTYYDSTITFEYIGDETGYHPYAISVYSESGELLGHLYDPNEILIINNPLVVKCNIGDKFILTDRLSLLSAFGCSVESIAPPIKGQVKDDIVTVNDNFARIDVE